MKLLNHGKIIAAMLSLTIMTACSAQTPAEITEESETELTLIESEVTTEITAPAATSESDAADKTWEISFITSSVYQIDSPLGYGLYSNSLVDEGVVGATLLVRRYGVYDIKGVKEESVYLQLILADKNHKASLLSNPAERSDRLYSVMIKEKDGNIISTFGTMKSDSSFIEIDDDDRKDVISALKENDEVAVYISGSSSDEYLFTIDCSEFSSAYRELLSKYSDK